MSEIKLFLLGNPNQNETSCNDKDATFYQSFYNQNTTNRFEVEIRESKCYYTYLRFGLNGFSGRSGAYLGLSLRSDIYCMDVVGIYRVLDMVYNKYVIGHFVEHKKYSIGSFSDKKNEIAQMDAVIGDVIGKLFVQNDFVSIDNSFVKSKQKTSLLNIIDCTKDGVMKMLKEHGSVVISETTDSQKCVGLKADLENSRATIGKQLADANQLLQEEKNEGQRLKNEVDNLKKQLNQIKDDFAKKEKEINILKNYKDIIEKIKAPILSIAKSLDTKNNNPVDIEDSDGRKKNGTGVLTWLTLLNSALIILLFSFVAWRGMSNSTHNESVDISQYQKEISELKKGMTKLRDENKKLEGQLQEIGTQHNNEVSVVIDVNNYNTGDSLEVGKTYKMTAKNAKNGEWKADGLEYNTNKRTELSLEFTVREESRGKTATVSFTPNGEEKVKRAFNVKK